MPLYMVEEQHVSLSKTVLYIHQIFIGQPTSVASERVFSSAGNILNSLRNRLSDENVDILIFLAKNNK